MITKVLLTLGGITFLSFLYSKWLNAKMRTIRAPEDVSEPPEGAEHHEQGLRSRLLREGDSDASPGPRDIVIVHYTGWTTDGEMFDSSVARGEPATFPLDKVIKGWTLGLQLMVVNEQRRFWIPAELAYGDSRSVHGPAGMLVFDVELLAVRRLDDPFFHSAPEGGGGDGGEGSGESLESD